jgi:hypothetical protein
MPFAQKELSITKTLSLASAKNVARLVKKRNLRRRRRMLERLPRGGRA